MKIMLLVSKVEFTEMLKRLIPAEFVPKKSFVVDFEAKGYPEKEYLITITEEET